MDGIISQQPQTEAGQFSTIDTAPDVFTRIYDDQTNLVIYQRDVPPEIPMFVNKFLKLKPSFSFTHVLRVDQIRSKLETSLPDHEHRDSFINDLDTICDMFAVLFDLGEIGIRLRVLSHAMCPRFHVDHIPCRLLTTYGDTGTEWISEHDLDRSKLGRGNGGLPDETSGIVTGARQINILKPYDIALLKGESWPDNEGKGVVHRSPSVNEASPELLLSLDFV